MNPVFPEYSKPYPHPGRVEVGPEIPIFAASLLLLAVVGVVLASSKG